MRTSKDAVHGVNIFPGISLVAKRAQDARPTKKELENLLTKDCNSPESNTENMSPPSRRRRKEAASVVQPASPKQKARIPKATNRELRAKRNGTHNRHETELNSSSKHDLSGDGSETPEQSKLNESSLCISGNESYADDSQSQTQETPNSSLIVDDEENTKSNRKLRSSRRQLPAAVIEIENVKVDTAIVVIEGSEALSNSSAVLEASQEDFNLDIKIVDAVTSKEQTDAIAPLIKADEPFIVENGDHTQAIKLDAELKEVKVETVADNATYVDEVDNLNIHEEKNVISDNPLPLPIASIKSPSAISIDSAKGSSIGNDSDCTIYGTGDLFWGRIHNFTYWACMICPDDSDEENLITRLTDQQMEVHVRFFADNARHSWVKRENLMPYQGLESYREHLRELKHKFGEKNLKYQYFLPKRTKLKTWLDAVKEADVIAAIPYPERMKKFFELNEVARERNKEERMRRKSMSISQSTRNLIDNNTSEQLDQSQDMSKKRNRSESPVSPAFSPIRKIKRRKTTADITGLMKNKQDINLDDTPISKPSESEMETEYKTSLESRTIVKNAFLETPQFHEFHDIMKEYVMQGVQSEFVEHNLFIAVKNIWELKNILHKQMRSNQLLMNEDENGGKPVKRLSLRLKDMQQRQRIEAPPASIATTTHKAYLEERHRLSSTSKAAKVTRPIEEVIDDIFNLDNRYLFDNMGRDPVCKYCYQYDGELKRCSTGCLSWFHSGCIQTGNIPSPSNTPNKTKTKSVAKKRSTKRESITAPSLTPTVRSKLHVTGDTDENDNENVQLTKIEVESDDKSVELVPMHSSEITKETIVCKECLNNEEPKCFICHTNNKQQILSNGDQIEENVISCNMMHCPRVYHPSCLKYWPQAKMTKSKNSIDSLRCPSHVCHTCVSDDPKGKFQHLNNANTTKCVKCPATYHMDSTCIPAGSQVLTAAHIICPRHGMSKSDQNINVNWCFICVRGGQLICCETCPTSVHAECSNVALDPNESYICDECESGRMPLYGEMVWAKLANYRWWPGIILPPTEVPLNIQNKVHNPFEFVIRFFGTHDHGWISRRRVYLYQEGDWSEPPRSTNRNIDKYYARGVVEAKEAYEIIKTKTSIRIGENENKEKLHPQPYVKIRVNRAVPPVKLHPNLEKVGKCECDPDEESPCGPDTNCLNRVLYHECNRKICPAGERCQNQMFETRVSPALEIIYAKKERGFGLQCREAIPAGTFVIEYVGEVINSVEFDRRMQQKSIDRDENYYFLYVEKDYIIDAGPKGNMARFMNHSCDPNCETQKWSVNGLNRVGLFTIKDVPANTELTFNYHWDELLSNDKKVCYCGSKNCTGQIGKLSKDVKLKQLSMDELPTSANAKNSKTEQSKPKKKRKRGKNITLKLISQKRNQTDVQVSIKSKAIRRKKQTTNATTDSDGSKSAE